MASSYPQGSQRATEICGVLEEPLKPQAHPGGAASSLELLLEEGLLVLLLRSTFANSVRILSKIRITELPNPPHSTRKDLIM